MTDGNIAVKGHHNKKEHLPCSKEVQEKELSDAASIGDYLLLREEVHQHSGSHNEGVGCIQEGQVAQKEVEGGREARV